MTHLLVPTPPQEIYIAIYCNITVLLKKVFFILGQKIAMFFLKFSILLMIFLLDIMENKIQMMLLVFSE